MWLSVKSRHMRVDYIYGVLRTIVQMTVQPTVKTIQASAATTIVHNNEGNANELGRVSVRVVNWMNEKQQSHIECVTLFWLLLALLYVVACSATTTFTRWFDVVAFTATIQTTCHHYYYCRRLLPFSSYDFVLCTVAVSAAQWENENNHDSALGVCRGWNSPPDDFTMHPTTNEGDCHSYPGSAAAIWFHSSRSRSSRGGG